MCLGVALLDEYLCGVLCISWTWIYSLYSLPCLVGEVFLDNILKSAFQLGFILPVLFRYTSQVWIRSCHITLYFLEALLISFHSFFLYLPSLFISLSWSSISDTLSSAWLIQLLKLVYALWVLVLCFSALSGHLYYSLSCLFSLAFCETCFQCSWFVCIG